MKRMKAAGEASGAAKAMPGRAGSGSGEGEKERELAKAALSVAELGELWDHVDEPSDSRPRPRVYC